MQLLFYWFNKDATHEFVLLSCACEVKYVMLQYLSFCSWG